VASLTLEARPKLNLRLLVGPRRGDGYHPVRTLMVEIGGVRDVVTLAPARRRSVRCPGLDGPANLAWRALDALEEAVGRPLPLAVTIEKGIPSQAGLGGGSSDAARVLTGVDDLLGLGLGAARLGRIAAAVGSDVPFFIQGGAQWAEGRGERLRPGACPAFAGVVLVPARGLTTAAVYRAYDRLPPPPADDGGPAQTRFGDLPDWVRNDLWLAALACDPSLGRSMRALRAAGASAAVLCGSGAAVVGLAADGAAAERLLARLRSGDADGVRALPIWGPYLPS
jgi:4-diphosphocytidyl-2-C-methyl-D-erythritol kinase